MQSAEGLEQQHPLPNTSLLGTVKAAVANWNLKTRRLWEQLRAYGMAGVLAYGILNTLYYSCAFTFFWVYVIKVPTGLGLKAAGGKFAEVFALTWAGSQVTKVPRAAGALVLAPFVDRGLRQLQRRMHLESPAQAVLLAILACLAIVFLLFGGLVLAWA